MAQATRAKNDKPDTVYFDDWFVQVPLSELIGKTVYIDSNCGDSKVRKKLKAMGIHIVSKKDFYPSTCDYIVVSTGWMKTQRKYLTTEDEMAWLFWKKNGRPQRLNWNHIFDELQQGQAEAQKKSSKADAAKEEIVRTEVNGFVIENGVLVQYTGTDAHVVVPDAVERIRFGVFEDNTSITQVTFPKGIKDVGRFCGCTALKSITIPFGVESIRYRAFENCTSLTEITIPESVAKIEADAFGNCTSLLNITIPNDVLEIGSGAFYGCASLSNIIIPNSVTTLGSRMFSGCISLESVTLSENLNELKGYLFKNCTSLTSIFVPDCVKHIDKYAFFNALALKNITIGTGTEAITEGMFSYCPKLEHVVLLGAPTVEKGTFDGINVTVIAQKLLQKEGFSWCAKRLGMDSTVATGFEGFCLNSNFAKSAKKNYKDVFTVLVKRNASALVPLFLSLWQETGPVVLEDLIGIASKGDAPEILAILSEVKLNVICRQNMGREPQTLAEWELFYSLTESDQGYIIHAYKGYEKEVVLPDRIGNRKVVGIHARAFEKTVGVTSVVIPESFHKVDASAFAGCTTLTKVTIPKTVCVVEKFAFYGCTALSQISFSDSITTIGEAAFEDCTSLSEITLPHALRAISARTFQNCTSLQAIEIPRGIEEIGDSAFCGCSALVNIRIPDAVSRIGNYAFKDCVSLADINIPQNTRRIGDYAFSGCILLKNVLLADAVTEIGNGAFANCTALEFINIPSTVQKIGEYAFRGTAITTISIPEGVAQIGKNAFEGCKSLAKISIPKSVTTIDKHAFNGCDALTEIHVDENNVVYCTIDGSLYTKDGKILILYAANKESKVLVLPESVTTIATGAFSAAFPKYLEKIIFPKGKVHIEESAFPCFHGIKFVTSLDGAMWKEYVDRIVNKTSLAPKLANDTDDENMPALSYGKYGIRIGHASPDGGMCYRWKDVVFQSLEEAENWLSFNEPANCDSIEIVDSAGTIVGGSAY